jgi:hypothetical protein
MQHCKRQSVPIIWDRQTYVNHGAVDLWEQQADFGYCTGIAMALHLPEGKHFLLGVDRDQPLPQDPDELQRVVADLQLFAVLAQDAAVRLLVPKDEQPDRPALTHRGVACELCDAQAGLRQQAPGRAQGAAAGTHPVTPVWCGLPTTCKT